MFVRQVCRHSELHWNIKTNTEHKTNPKIINIELLQYWSMWNDIDTPTWSSMCKMWGYL